MTIGDALKKFDLNHEIETKVDEALVKLRGVRSNFPFDTSPESIDALTAEMLFNPKDKPNYFFYWVEHGLKDLGAIGLGSTAPWLNACRSIITLRELLHRLMTPGLSIAERVDLPWETIKGFGQDRTIAKKIISMYFDDVLPIFKTRHLEEIHAQVIGRDRLTVGYRKLSLGEKYQMLTKNLMEVKNTNKITAVWNNAYFVQFLYQFYPPWRRTVQQAPVPRDKLLALGLLNEPQTEQEVVFLFAKIHQRLGFSEISKIQTNFPDVQATDTRRNVVRIELEVRASGFLEHDHPPSGCDVVVCWENDLGDGWPHSGLRVVQLRDYL